MVKTNLVYFLDPIVFEQLPIVLGRILGPHRGWICCNCVFSFSFVFLDLLRVHALDVLYMIKFHRPVPNEAYLEDK